MTLTYRDLLSGLQPAGTPIEPDDAVMIRSALHSGFHLLIGTDLIGTDTLERTSVAAHFRFETRHDLHLITLAWAHDQWNAGWRHNQPFTKSFEDWLKWMRKMEVTLAEAADPCKPRPALRHVRQAVYSSLHLSYLQEECVVKRRAMSKGLIQMAVNTQATHRNYHLGNL